MQTTEARTEKRPRIFYGWYIVGASVLMNSYFSIAFWQGFTVFFLPILRDFGWSRTMLSSAFSLRQVESGIMSPVVGFLVDKIGPRRVILSGVIIASIGLMAISFTRNLWTFYLFFMLTSAGVGAASHGVSWAVLVSRWFIRKRGRATSLAMMGGAVGGPGVIIISMLEGWIGWRSAVFGLGAGLLAVGIPLALVARPWPHEYGVLPDGDQPSPDEQRAPVAAGAAHAPRAAASQGPSLSTREALRSGAFWGLVAVFGARQMGMGGLQVHQIAYFQDLGFSSALAASTVAIAFSVSAIGRLLVGVLMDKFDWRRVMAVIFVGQICAFLVLVNVTTYPQAVAFAAIQGLFQGMMVPSGPIIVGTVFGTRSFGTIWGMLDGLVVISGVLGPIYLGWTFDTFGSYKPALLAVSALAAAAIPLFFVLPRSKVAR